MLLYVLARSLPNATLTTADSYSWGSEQIEHTKTQRSKDADMSETSGHFILYLRLIFCTTCWWIISIKSNRGYEAFRQKWKMFDSGSLYSFPPHYRLLTSSALHSSNYKQLVGLEYLLKLLSAKGLFQWNNDNLGGSTPSLSDIFIGSGHNLFWCL